MILDIAVPIRDTINETGAYPTLVPGGAALSSIISTIAEVLIILSGLAFFIFFIIAAYKWLTAGGEESKVEEARTQITNAIIGLAIAASAFVVYQIVTAFFGISTITRSPSGDTGRPCPCSVGELCNPGTNTCWNTSDF